MTNCGKKVKCTNCESIFYEKYIIIKISAVSAIEQFADNEIESCPVCQANYCIEDFD